MSNLEDITSRHLLDRWKDAVFIAVAVILTALSIGSVSHKTHVIQGSVTMTEQPELAK